MARKSGSKSSRNERSAGRKRAERAREHGLPERREPPARVRASIPQPGSQRDGEDRSSDAPPARVPKPTGIPTLVKVIGGALVILLGVYLLSRQRDETLTEIKPAPELPAASAAPEPEPAPAVSDSSAPAPATPGPARAPEVAPAPVLSVAPPMKPVVTVPVVANPAVPKVEKPRVAAAKPLAPVALPAAPVAAAPAPVAVAAAPPAPGPVPAAPAPAAKPVAPKPVPPAKPADNPY